MTTSSWEAPPDGDWLGTSLVKFHREGRIGVCTIDRARKRNALTPLMYFAIRYAVEHVTTSEDLDALVITGTEDTFSVGGDFGHFGAPPGEERGWEYVLLDAVMADASPVDRILRCPKPVISAVNGLAHGGGFAIALVSDVSIATPAARFRVPELQRGLADTGMAQLVAWQLGPARARDLLLSAREITGEEAAAWGLVTRLANPDQLLDTAIAVARDCCKSAPSAFASVKSVINAGLPTTDWMTFERSINGPEFAEGAAAFREKRLPAWVKSG